MNMCSTVLLVLTNILHRFILDSVDRCVQRVSAIEEKVGEFGKVADEKKKEAAILKIK